ncbi:MAG: hypothetical protein EOP85_23180 [Verrucomicrobiaceae bacterium]|nr:MAG: hypothetical protein EOP85_23180 [Verrucomicrobiaceae bacterium]
MRNLPLLAVLPAICCSTAADAALTLTIDTNAKTFWWSGTVTSEAYELKPYSTWLQIADNSFNGGFIFGESPLLTTPSVIGNGISAFDSKAGQIVLRTSVPSIHTLMATFQYNAASPVLAPFTVTGNNQAQTFTYLAIPYFETLNGRALYFYDVGFGGPPIRFGASVGTIVVIPEPSVGLLSLGSLALPFMRKRK